MAILFVLRGAATDVHQRPMDAVEPDLVNAAEASVRRTPGMLEVQDVRLRWIGHLIRTEVGVLVDSGLGPAEAYEIANQVHHQLLHDVAKLDDVTVHVGPFSPDGQDHHFALEHHRPRTPATDT